MRNLLLFAIAAMIAVSCTKEQTCTQSDPNQIQFRAGLLSTKAPISGNIPGVALTGIQILRAPDGASADWTNIAAVTTTADVAVTTGTVTPATAQYFNANDSHAWFMAYYPAATIITTDKVSWTITGQEDILVAPSVDAGTKTTPLTPTLAFAHKLAQLQFKVKADDDAAITAWGTVTYIKVNTATTLELKPSTAAFSVASSNVNADLSVANVTYPLTLTTSYQNAGTIMLYPGVIGSVTIKVKTSLGYEQSITISSLTMVAGSAHEIALTFNATGITLGASLSDWIEGDDATGSVQ